MAVVRVVLLWHMHQPFYKDLVSREYRLPWVRMHGLKDYFGMVKLAEEFPDVHQTFNLVPSLITQLQEYASGSALDPLLELAAKPTAELSPEERRHALEYLFQANPIHLIGRYPRYHELWQRFHGAGENPGRADRFFQTQDYTDLQVLSQLAWFDEFWLKEAGISALVQKGYNFTEDDKRFVIAEERQLLGKVLPQYKNAADAGLIEISTSPFYHPILPLLCDTNAGSISNPGLPLPQNRFHRPEDARAQLQSGLDLHEHVFGRRPQGVWPSEGSVSEEVLALAHDLGVKWMATDEGVLGRSLGFNFARDPAGHLPRDAAQQLYSIYSFEKPPAEMKLFFRDHTLSDLIGFVYSGMPAKDAATHLIQSIKASAESLISQGKDAVVSIILDGENAWEYYPESGREFLRRFYAGLQADPQLEAVTASEAIGRQTEFCKLSSFVPGSWINSNFNIWIGAPEDNKSWDYLTAARNLFSDKAAGVDPSRRDLAWQELQIAEGSDWNWWYGPEHHSINDRDFDELYRKHLTNVYQALGAEAPEYLAQPIYGGVSRPMFVPQTVFIHPRIEGSPIRYFAWLGAAMYTADRRSGAMHGKRFLLDSVYAGIDDEFLYGRLDFIGQVPKEDFDLHVIVESFEGNHQKPQQTFRLQVVADQGLESGWRLCTADKEITDSENPVPGAKVVLGRNFEFKLPLSLLLGSSAGAAGGAGRLRLRFSIWRDHLPIDALPVEGWVELHLVPEQELAAMSYSA